MKDLKVGMRVYLRDDLQEGVRYSTHLDHGGKYWISKGMMRGCWVYISKVIGKERAKFFIEDGGEWVYTYDLIDWDKTKEQETMNKLEAGMWVYLRDDLQENEKYGDVHWVKEMYKGIWVQIDKIYDEINAFRIYDQGIFIYTPEMIDWEKTKRGNETMYKLEAGMWVYLRDDLQENEKYGYTAWVSSMHKGIWARIKYISDDYATFRISIQENFVYTPEMIDWEKTKRGKETMEDMKRYNKQECKTTKSKLKFKLYNEGNLIIFSILEQCPSITRRMGGDELKFKSSNGFEFYSLSKTELIFPEIDDDGDNVFILIFLRGSNDYNQSPTTATLRCEDEEQAKYLIKEMLKAFQEFKENDYFTGKEDTTTLELDEENKYQVYEI